MAELPRGTVTFLFTDIEGSTRLLQELKGQYTTALQEHREIVRDAFHRFGGIELGTEGDAFFIAFTTPQAAVEAAVTAQRGLAEHVWPGGSRLQVRMGIHTGTPEMIDHDYVGPDVHLVSRICSVAWGGQIVVSSSTAGVISSLKEIDLRPVGKHALKDFDERVSLYQVVAPGVREDFPALRTVHAHPTNLPPRIPALIGRQGDISALTELIPSPDVAVVTLVGPGGTGKTRLSLAVGTEMLSSFADGVFFVDLSSLTEASLVITSIAQTLSLKETPGRSLEKNLADHVGSREMLLILDNFEQVIEAAPQLSSLLQEAPALKVMVTSREALRISGERVVSVAPLPVPSADIELDEVANSPAVALFVARAQAVKGDFALDEDNVSDIAAICRRLDGLPLALELAAARVNVLSLSSLNARLDQGMKVLSTGRRDASDRQRTLRGAIAWSYELLTREEQKLFRRLGVFAGGWSLEAAESVCDDGDLELDVLDGLASLVDKNLVRTSPARADRFSMLETIREFALEQLTQSIETGDTTVWNNFLSWLIAQTMPPDPVAKEWLDLIESEIDNVRSGLTLASNENARALCEIALNLTPYWQVRGPLAEGRRWLETSLGQCDSSWVDLQAHIKWAYGFITSWLGDLDVSSQSFEEALHLARDIGDRALEARTLGGLGTLAQNLGNLRAAQEWLEQSLERAREAHESSIESDAVGDLGVLAAIQGDFETARDQYETSLRIKEKIGDVQGATLLLYNLGEVAQALGETADAARLWRKCFENFTVTLKDRYRAAATVRSFALMRSEVDPERAAVALGAAEAVIQALGSYDPEWLLPPRFARRRDDCIATLGTERYNHLRVKGAAMHLEDAAEFVGLVH
jgi:predicted ATPase/class 3 adenylate cyclase